MARKAKRSTHPNPKLAEGLAQIAYGGGWGTHLDKRTKRSRTRQNATERAVKDYE